MSVPAPRPGTLEWLTDQRPDEEVLLTPGGAVTRARWEADAEALAEHLAGGHDVVAGTLLSAAGRVGPQWFTQSWAAAKLGAGLAGLPPGPVADLDDALHVENRRDANSPRGQMRQVAAERRFSGTAPPPDSVTFSRLGRPVRRRFAPGGVVAIGATLADLVARVRAVPGTTLVASGPVSDPVVTFLASVVLVGGGRVLTAPEPAEALALAAEHDATLATLSPADLATLASADPDALDLMGIAALVIGGAPFDTAAGEDLFGEVVDVYATADTGVIAVRAPGTQAHVLLDGVTARTTPGGLLEVRSPLAARAGWVPTGDRAELTGGGAALRLG